MRIKVALTTKAPVELPQLYMQKEDKDTDIFSTSSRVRSCAVGGCPAVFTLNEPRNKVQLTRDWQYYLLAINYNMTRENVFLLLDNHLAFANQTGFENLDNPGKKDFFFGRTAYSEFPRFDKDRTCSRNLLSGVEIDKEYLHVKTMNGNNSPPLKPGRSYPSRIQDIKLEDYLYSPQENPEMFVVANRVTTKPGNQTSVAPFPRGAIYPWTGDNLPYSFLPLVSREDILYPLKYLYKIPLGGVIPSPYRIVTTVRALFNFVTRKKEDRILCDGGKNG